MNIETMTARIEHNRNHLNELKTTTISMIENKEKRPELFQRLVAADFHSEQLNLVYPHDWGFSKYDSRFLRSLRNQILGIIENKPAKPLTVIQIDTLRPIMMREPYTTQLILLNEFSE